MWGQGGDWAFDYRAAGKHLDTRARTVARHRPEPRRPHYWRLPGPNLLIEYDNTQNDANHIHSVWHHPGRDFGADLLRRHYEHRPHRAGALSA